MSNGGYRAWYPWGGIDGCVGGLPPENVLSIDLETTGLDPSQDEILQLSICDGLEREVVNKLYRPTRARSWPKAEAVNGISPRDVRSVRPFSPTEARKVSDLLNEADLVVGYNWWGFDRKFLEAAGVRVTSPCFDVMLEYPIVPGAWDDRHGHWKWWKLVQCAEHYSHSWTGRAHDALSDAVATAWCYRRMVEPGSDYCTASNAVNRGDWDSVLRDYTGTLRSDYTTYPVSDELDDSVARCFIYGLPDGLIAKRAERDVEQALAERGGRRYKSEAKGAAWTCISDPEWDARRCADVFERGHEKGKKVCYLPELVEYLGVDAKSLATKWPAGRRRAERELKSWFPVPSKLGRETLDAADRPRVVVSEGKADFPSRWQELDTRPIGLIGALKKMLFS